MKKKMKNLLKLIFGVVMVSSQIANAACGDLYNHQFDTLQGKKINLCDYQNKPILVVNTASKCGFTPQFEVLESMSTQYKGKLLVIGFPSNDFKQELSDNKEVGEFCIKTYSVKFPMVVKTSVVGANANPLHKALYVATKQAPMWNFHKYLILPGGKDVYSYSSDVQPNALEVMDKLKPFLK
jgi:glutathione peroxidase